MVLLRNSMAASCSNLKRSRVLLLVAIRIPRRSGRSLSALNSRMFCGFLLSITSKSSLARLVTKRPLRSVTVYSRLTRVTSTWMRVGSSAWTTGCWTGCGSTGFCSAAQTPTPTAAKAARRAQNFIWLIITLHGLPRPATVPKGFVADSASRAIDDVHLPAEFADGDACDTDACQRFLQAAALFLGADKGHYTEQDCGLALGSAGVLLEVRLGGQVVAELKPAHQPATHLVFAGKGRFLYPLRRAGGETVRIVEPFQASGEGELLGQGIARRAGDTGPHLRAVAEVLVASVIEVDVVTELVVGVDQDRGVV